LFIHHFLTFFYYTKNRAITALENLTRWGRIKCDPLATVTSVMNTEIIFSNLEQVSLNIEFMFSIGALHKDANIFMTRLICVFFKRRFKEQGEL